MAMKRGFSAMRRSTKRLHRMNRVALMWSLAVEANRTYRLLQRNAAASRNYSFILEQIKSTTVAGIWLNEHANARADEI